MIDRVENAWRKVNWSIGSSRGISRRIYESQPDDAVKELAVLINKQDPTIDTTKAAFFIKEIAKDKNSYPYLASAHMRR